MALCSGCGSEVPPGVKFCTRCGRPVAAVGAPTVSCPRCGAPQTPGTRFCTGCGSPLPAQPPVAMPPAPTPPRMAPPASPISYGGPNLPPNPGLPPRPAPPAGMPNPAPMQPAGMPPGAGFAPASKPKRGGGWVLVSIFLVLVVAAAGAGGYLLYQKFKAPSEGFEKQVDALANQVASEGEAATPESAGGAASTPGTSSPAAGGMERVPEALAGNERGTAPTAQPAPANPRFPTSTGAGSGAANSRATTPSPPGVTAPPRATATAAAPASRGPSDLPAVWGSVVTESPTPVPGAAPRPASPRESPLAADAAPRSGVIIWSGPLRKDSVVTIEGESATFGTVRGSLPGVPVIVETDYKDVGFAEMPSPSNGWKRISMRGRKNINVVVTLRWRALE